MSALGVNTQFSSNAQFNNFEEPELYLKVIQIPLDKPSTFKTGQALTITPLGLVGARKYGWNKHSKVSFGRDLTSNL